MARWRFFDYVTEDDHNLIAEWYEAQDDEVRAQFDVALYILGGTENWEEPKFLWFKPLSETHPGLGEVRFHVYTQPAGAIRPYRRRFRPVGIWPPRNVEEFILILGCEKGGRNTTPHDAFRLALMHKALLEEGRGSVREHV